MKIQTRKKTLYILEKKGSAINVKSVPFPSEYFNADEIIKNHCPINHGPWIMKVLWFNNHVFRDFKEATNMTIAFMSNRVTEPRITKDVATNAKGDVIIKNLGIWWSYNESDYSVVDRPDFEFHFFQARAKDMKSILSVFNKKTGRNHVDVDEQIREIVFTSKDAAIEHCIKVLRSRYLGIIKYIEKLKKEL